MHRDTHPRAQRVTQDAALLKGVCSGLESGCGRHTGTGTEAVALDMNDTPQPADTPQPVKERMYLDTSVVSAWYDDRVPEWRDVTRRFWEKTIPEYRVFVSDVAKREIQRTKDPQRRQDLLDLIAAFEVINLAQDSEALAQTFINDGLLSAKKRDDVHHLAIAVVHGMDILVSWNYDDMVNRRTKRLLPMLSVKHGYFRQLSILTPWEFFEEEGDARQASTPSAE